jgi:hypothetical protein
MDFCSTHLRLLLLIVGCALWSPVPGAWCQTGEIDKSPPKGITPEEILRRFTANEKQWKGVREQYSFRESIHVQALENNEVTGDYQQVADISYSQGQRVKKVVLAPQAGIDMSKEDIEDLEGRASFTISTDELPVYSVVYEGQQKVDELHCYVFQVAPKAIGKDQRYFQGRIWVDDQDFQIVKDTGKSVPDIRIVKKKKTEENLFPQFTTWREQIDGKYWFPTFSSADDTLHFTSKDVRLKQVVKLSNYQRAGAKN